MHRWLVARKRLERRRGLKSDSVKLSSGAQPGMERCVVGRDDAAAAVGAVVGVPRPQVSRPYDARKVRLPGAARHLLAPRVLRGVVVEYGPSGAPRPLGDKHLPPGGSDIWAFANTGGIAQTPAKGVCLAFHVAKFFSGSGWVFWQGIDFGLEMGEFSAFTAKEI